MTRSMSLATPKPLARRRGRLRATALAAALAASALGATGCGNDVPEGAVAKVGEARIEKSEFDNWLSAAAQSQQTAGPGGQTVVPDPPDYEQCIAALREQSAPPGGQDAPPTPSPEELRRQCEQQYEALKQQVMQFLIQAEAIQQEAAARNIEISDEEVVQQLEDQKKQSFKNEQEYQEFLETSGRSEEDLLFQLRLDLLSNRIRESVVSGTPVTDTQVQAYYDQNSERPPIGEPETRDVEVVLTEDEAEAQKAREEIDDGASFAQVAKKYSIDETSASNGGKLEDVQEGQQEMAFDDAVFAAEEGELVGPIETEFGFYVFRVTDVQPAQQQSLEESREAITQILQSEREQTALNEFIERFEKEYTDKTVCAEDYVIQGCGNAPEDQPPVSGAPPDGAPQGAPPPQGQPPQSGTPAQPGPGGLDPQQGAPQQGAPQQGAPPQGAPPQGAPQGSPPQGGGGPGG